MKIRSFIWTFFSLTGITGLTSCSTIIAGLYGIKPVKPVDEKIISHYSIKYNIPKADGYQLDSSYDTFLASFDPVRYTQQIKNHYQPLQALYYNNAGQLISFHINCYANGFINLHWNKNDIMAVFPPKQQAPLDSIVSLETQLKYLKPLSTTLPFSNESYDHIIIVYWSRFMGRQSKRLIHSVQNNSKIARSEKVKIIYVNTDNFFAGQ